MAEEESKLLIIGTGGTICMRPSASGLIPANGFLDAGMAPRPSFNDGSKALTLDAYTGGGDAVALPSLRTPKSRYGKHVRYAVLEFKELLDSSSVDARGWDQIASVIDKNYASFDGFVVLHGTDTLAYTASALSFMLGGLAKPVVLVGSQAPIYELQADATDNLLDALIIAGHFRIPEVCICFQHKLFRGNRCRKVSASEFEAFASPNLVPLATVSSSQITVNWHLVQKPPAPGTPLDVQMNLYTGHVACLRVFPGILPEMVQAVLRVRDLRGLILETFGAGNAPGGPDSGLVTVLSEAVRKDIVIVNVTQCMTGSVSPLYAPAMALGNAGIVLGYDMTTEAALTKLSYLLAIPGLSTAEVTRRMAVALRGELTLPQELGFASAS